MKNSTASADATNYSWENIRQQLGLIPAAAPAGKNLQYAGVQYRGQRSIPELMRRRCVDGERTAHLTALAGALIADRYSLDECVDHCRLWNQGNHPPLDDIKLVKTCESISASDLRNHPDRYDHPQRHEPLFHLDAGRVGRYLSAPPPTRRWLLRDLVVLGRVGSIVAPGGSSKSQWLLQLGVSVATGIPMAGHWEVGETGGVLVLFAEDDDDEIHRRLYRIQSSLRMAGHASELAAVDDRLFIFSTIGTETLLTKKGASGEVSATEIVDRVVALAKQIPDLRLIVIDPGSRFRGGEENSNEDATRFVEALENLAKQTGASVMLAHHTNKGALNSSETNQGASRGASALTDGLRWQMNLGRPTESQGKSFGLFKDELSRYVMATVTKTNYSAIPAPILLERGSDGYLSAVNPANAKQNLEQQDILKVARVIDRENSSISARDLEDRFGGIKKELNVPKQRVRDVIKLGIARGYLEGGERKPLSITKYGADMLRSFPAPTADATHDTKTLPRKKTQ